MTSVTDIVNRALQLLGTRTSVTDAELAGGTSNEAIQANIAFLPVQNWCFGLANWNFARKTAPLAIAKGPPPQPPGTWNLNLPPPPWLYEYTLPTGFIRALYVTNSDAGAVGFLGEPKRFVMATDTVASVHQEVLLTNEPAAILVYTVEIDDPTLWPWYFERLVSLALAQTLSASLVGNLKITEELSSMVEQQISIAIQVNTAEGLIIDDSTPEWIQALGINYPYRRIDGRNPAAPSPSRRGEGK